MNTPIYNFVTEYRKKNISRLHMPGHKGKSFLGCEAYDITEIQGADELFTANGIIHESECNASNLFGTAHSFYSTEGSSLAIRTMLALALSHWKECFSQSISEDCSTAVSTLSSVKSENGIRPYILAARNVHKSFVYGCALLDLDVEWIYPENFKSLCSCEVTAATVEKLISKAKVKPIGIYLTSPDYLGFVQDIEGIARVCEEYQVPLLVDNAHGAYTRFLKPSKHPIDLGAAMCCDSAHKTLPVLTGGAYLHISKNAPESFIELARNTMAVFASTSPSYVIMQSLDLCNQYLADQYEDKLERCISHVNELKAFITSNGFTVEASEPLKVVINTLKSGYTGEEMSGILRTFFIEAEFADPEYVVMMFTPETGELDYNRIKNAFSSIKIKEPLDKPSFSMGKALRKCSIREAVFGVKEIISSKKANGRISGSPSVSCPPAIPIVVSGEVITEDAIRLFEYYGIDFVEVIK